MAMFASLKSQIEKYCSLQADKFKQTELVFIAGKQKLFNISNQPTEFVGHCPLQ